MRRLSLRHIAFRVVFSCNEAPPQTDKCKSVRRIFVTRSAAALAAAAKPWLHGRTREIRTHSGRASTASFVLFVMLCRPAVAGASARPDEQSGTTISTSQSLGTPDFLFGRPNGSIGIRSGWMLARAGSDLFTFVQDKLTINRKDFNAPALAVDLGIVVAPRTEALFGFDFSRSSTASEYRAFVDNNRRPIRQDTRLQQINLSGSVKFALMPRGREVSRYAWVPRTVTPYVGAGGGALRYEFRQEGDFVDFANFHVFSDTFRSVGWTPSAHAFGGVDVKLWRRLYFTGEARYLWSHARLGRDFSGFQPIDLAGFKMTAGISGVF